MKTFRSQLLIVNLVILSLIQSVSASVELTAEAYGKDLQQAQERARASLASQIFVYISSNSESYESDQGGNYFHSSVISKTDLPLFGVSLECYAAIKQQYCSATMNTSQALPLYKNKLNQSAKDINLLISTLSKTPVKLHYDYLEQLLSLYEQFEKYQTVLTFLTEGKASYAKLSVTKQELKRRLLALEKKVISLELAAKLISREIKQSKIYIQPATLENSREVTPFAGALLKHLTHLLNTTSDINNAKYYFSGHYEIHKNSIQVQYSLKNASGETLKTRLVELSPASYKNYRTTPLAIDFDQLLHKGFVVSSDFKVQLNTNKGRSQLLFQSGETVKLLVKLNQAGYVYIVGHTKNKDLEQSYLLDLNDAGNDRRFIMYINADDVNKWITIGEFEASPPFGLESIQLFASAKDPVDSLPHYIYNPELNYYVVSTNMEVAITKSRGIIRIKNKNNQIKTVEDVLIFTTQK